ncbi:uncharacterized protein [Drosophila takahashii]|uniref:uncharacterized protein n=1 Tax=Drosophila takahashii TaxID=29030 RepID=UPI001CF8B3BF|nr:uncharacterized protein LOC108054127 [Drosophila takahashii]
MRIIIPIFAIVFCGLSVVESLNCQECLTDNDVYCVNQTSYRNCLKSGPFGSVLNCPEGTVCTNSDEVCVPSSEVTGTIEDVCGTSGGNGCATCSSENYACVSQNQFARCSKQVLVDSNIYNCNADEICNSEALRNYNNICVPSCAADFLDLKATCSNSEYTTTTTAAPPTVTPSTEDKENACSKAGEKLGLASNAITYFFTIYEADTTCHTYLYCQTSDSKWETVYFFCPQTKPYYDSTKKVCVETKPTGCS